MREATGQGATDRSHVRSPLFSSPSENFPVLMQHPGQGPRARRERARLFHGGRGIGAGLGAQGPGNLGRERREAPTRTRVPLRDRARLAVGSSRGWAPRSPFLSIRLPRVQWGPHSLGCDLSLWLCAEMGGWGSHLVPPAAPRHGEGATWSHPSHLELVCLKFASRRVYGSGQRDRTDALSARLTQTGTATPGQRQLGAPPGS